MTNYGNAPPTEQTKTFSRGELIYCDILQVASEDWEVAAEGGNLLELQYSVSSWPRLLSIVLDDRPNLKVVRIYAISLNRCIRSPYYCLFSLEEDKK